MYHHRTAERAVFNTIGTVALPTLAVGSVLAAAKRTVPQRYQALIALGSIPFFVGPVDRLAEHLTDYVMKWREKRE